MACRSIMTVASVCLVLGLLNTAPGAGSSSVRACCTTYTRSPIPIHRVIGYKQQTLLENCDIEAIIFYTVKKNKICATPKDEWVRRTLHLLSIRLKKMSKPHTAVGKNLKKSSGNPLATNAKVIHSTTETSQNITETFNDL